MYKRSLRRSFIFCYSYKMQILNGKQSKSRQLLYLICIVGCFLLIVIIAAFAYSKIRDNGLLNTAKKDVHSAYITNEKDIDGKLQTSFGSKRSYNAVYCDPFGASDSRDLRGCYESVTFDTKMSINAADALAIQNQANKLLTSLGWKSEERFDAIRYTNDGKAMYVLDYTKQFPNNVNCAVDGNFGAGSPGAFVTYRCSTTVDLGPL
jgi:hypothetical protein